MKTTLSMKAFLAAGLMLASIPFAAPRADNLPAIEVCFQFAYAPAAVVIGRADTLAEAMNMVTQITAIDESASDEDRYILRDHRTSKDLVTVNLRGLRALQSK